MATNYKFVAWVASIVLHSAVELKVLSNSIPVRSTL